MAVDFLIAIIETDTTQGLPDRTYACSPEHTAKHCGVTIGIQLE
jgi:hypothetical protein